jgi:peptidyl-prolyl cis-trans isomerase A (cyclophilin A)
VRFETTAGDFVVEVVREMAPRGADRFYNLARHGYFDGVRFFRVINGFMAQFGAHGDPRVNATWRDQRIEDDPVRGSNRRGTVTFAATSRPSSRTTQVFVNTADNLPLDALGFAPIGAVVDGMAVVDALHSGYGEGAPMGNGPDQERIDREGNNYLAREFPDLDYIKQAVIVR